MVIQRHQPLLSTPVAKLKPKHTPITTSDLIHTSRGMYEQGLFTDAVLVVEGQALHVHRAVLAAASPVFHAMFIYQPGILEFISAICFFVITQSGLRLRSYCHMK